MVFNVYPTANGVITALLQLEADLKLILTGNIIFSIIILRQQFDFGPLKKYLVLPKILNNLNQNSSHFKI